MLLRGLYRRSIASVATAQRVELCLRPVPWARVASRCMRTGVSRAERSTKTSGDENQREQQRRTQRRWFVGTGSALASAGLATVLVLAADPQGNSAPST